MNAGRPLIGSPIPLRHAGDMSNEEKEEVVTTSSTIESPSAPRVSEADAKSWAVLTHLSAFVLFFGIPSVIGPVVLWAIKRQDSDYIDYHGKEAVNFNISFLIYAAVSAVLILALVGLVLLPIVAVTWLVLVIVGAVKAGAGEYYRYPLTIRFIN